MKRLRAFSPEPAAAFWTALALRLGFLLLVLRRPERLYLPDTFEYENAALNLVRHGLLSASPAAPFLPELFHPPGYPFLLAPFYFLLPVSAARIAAALAQAVAGAFVVPLTFRLARLAWPGKEHGRAAAWVAALDPISIAYGTAVYSDLPFALLFLWGVVRLFERPERPVSGALLLSFASLVRPVGFYVSALAAVPFFLRWKGWTRTGAPRVAVLLAALGCLPALWCARNLNATGRWYLTSMQANLHWRTAAVLAAAHGVPIEAARVQLDRMAGPPAPSPYLIPVERLERMDRLAGDILLAHVPAYLQVAALDALRVALHPEWDFLEARLAAEPGRGAAPAASDPLVLGGALRGRLGRGDPYAWFGLAYAAALGALWLLAGAGLLEARRLRSELPWTLLLLSLGFLALSAGLVGTPARLRMPFLPFLAVLAAGGLGRLSRR